MAKYGWMMESESELPEVTRYIIEVNPITDDAKQVVIARSKEERINYGKTFGNPMYVKVEVVE